MRAIFTYSKQARLNGFNHCQRKDKLAWTQNHCKNLPYMYLHKTKIRKIKLNQERLSNKSMFSKKILFFLT